MGRYINKDKIGYHPIDWCDINRWVAYMEEIEEMPEEDVVPVVHAKWVPHLRKEFLYDHGPEFEFVDDGYSCSKCKNYEAFKTNYCSKCGAKMDKDIEKQSNKSKTNKK